MTADGTRRRNREPEARRVVRAHGQHLWTYRFRVPISLLVGLGGLPVCVWLAVPPYGWSSPLDQLHDDVAVAIVLFLAVLWAFALLALTGLSEPVFSVRVLLEEGVPRERVRELLAEARSASALRQAVEREVAPVPAEVRGALEHEPGPSSAVARDAAPTARGDASLLRERRWLSEGGLWPYLWIAIAVAIGTGLGTVRDGAGFFTATMLWTVLGAAALQFVLAWLPVGQSFSSVVVRPGWLSVWSVPRKVDLTRVIAFGTVEVAELKDHVHTASWETWRTYATWRPWCAVYGGWYALQRCAVTVRTVEHPPAGVVWLTEVRPDGRPLGWLVGTGDPATLLDALERAGARGRLEDATPLTWELPEVAAVQVVGPEGRPGQAGSDEEAPR